MGNEKQWSEPYDRPGTATEIKNIKNYREVS
jgi:hypothetical protein